jgi:hypothetical protein
MARPLRQRPVVDQQVVQVGRKTVNGRLSTKYENTTSEISIGDAVFVDGHPGVVVAIFPACSSNASDFDCVNTGGVLFDLEGQGLTLIPFGHSSHVHLNEH